MRLAAQAKMGYYPTPEGVTEIIIRYLKRERKGHIRIFDPCSGEGTALYIVGNHLQAETYGIEIDLDRGEKGTPNASNRRLPAFLPLSSSSDLSFRLPLREAL